MLGLALIAVPAPASPPQPRLTAAARREQIVDAAVVEFARHGWHGARVEAVAARAGISHPYMLRLFSSKRELFMAALERAFERIEQAFRAAVQDETTDPLLAMGAAYRKLLRNPDELHFQLHAYAVAGEPDVGDAVRARYASLRRAVARLSGASPDRVRTFFAVGLALTVAATLELPNRAADLRWAVALLDAGA